MSVLHYCTTFFVPMSLPHCTITTTLYVVVVLVTGRVNSNLGNIYLQCPYLGMMCFVYTILGPS